MQIDGAAKAQELRRLMKRFNALARLLPTKDERVADPSKQEEAQLVITGFALSLFVSL
jgi:hypothetical protein